MRFRSDLRTAWLCALLLACAPASPLTAQTATPPTHEEIARVVEQLRADPNLGAPRKVKRLRRVDADKPKPPSKTPEWVTWLAGFFSVIASAGRVVFWVIGGILLIALIVFVGMLIRRRGLEGRAVPFVAPTHVQDLDIRPESLPADIGASAYALWERGEHRAALSLLYRGLLSRLVHVHAVPIRDSSTEGECVTLALRHLQQQRVSYVARLVEIWQHAVYGGKDPDTQSVRTLCDGFAPAMDRPV